MITYRTATRIDAPACSEILLEWVKATRWYPVENPLSASVGAMEERIQTGSVILALEAAEIIGFMSLEVGDLDCLYLKKTHQGQGVGAALLDQCKAIYPSGFNLWTLADNYDARRFYLREGLIETAQSNGEHNEDNLPDIQFYWSGERNTS